jgi:hypothetical protein
MLTFLRKIRRSFIDSGSARKYLLYAIGEIALVVIGILIALQVNNWNEERKTLVVEEAYLKRLLTDLHTDSLYFIRRLVDSRDEIDSYYKYIHEAREEQTSGEEFKSLVNLNSFSSEQLTVNNSTYLEMINAGHLNIIRNDSLKISIIDLYRGYESVGKHIEEINQFTTSMLLNMAMDVRELKYRRQTSALFDNKSLFDASEWIWINDPKSSKFRSMENTVSMYYAKHQIFINYFEDMLLRIHSLRTNVRKELLEANFQD